MFVRRLYAVSCVVGLETLTSEGNFALYDGKERVLETSKNSWIQTLELLWRYGLSLFKMGSAVDSYLKDFERPVLH